MRIAPQTPRFCVPRQAASTIYYYWMSHGVLQIPHSLLAYIVTGLVQIKIELESSQTAS